MSMISITEKPFGTCTLGAVTCITLSNDNGMSVDLLTLGATMRSIIVPDKHGTPTDVLLGYDTPQHYLDYTAYVGGCIGRIANRIGGASFNLDGQQWQITPNQDNTHHLHGGAFGYDKRLWDYEIKDGFVTFVLEDLHLEEGYPGDLHVEVSFALTEDNRLYITHQATTDRTTIVNITNHPYFNLNGHNSNTVDEHLVRVDAQFYTPATAANIPTGEIRSVTGTPLDLRYAARLGDCIHHPSLSGTRGLDHNYVLPDGDIRPIATLWSLESGISLDVSTTLPGFQIYTGGFLGEQDGKDGATYHNHYGVAMEPQFFPNAVNFPHFPSTMLRAGEAYNHRIEYHFPKAT